MIDTAQTYLNEETVGNAWKKSGISRNEIFRSKSFQTPSRSCHSHALLVFIG